MPRVVSAEGAILDRIMATSPATHDLSRGAFLKYHEAQARTAWALGHRRKVALMQGDHLLASAERYDLTGRLDGQPVRICGIAAVLGSAREDGRGFGAALVEQLVDDAMREGTDLALLFRDPNDVSPTPEGFEVVPTTDVALIVTESSRHGAPMTLVRGGEDRDLDAIVAMGRTRAEQCRFHLERNAEYIKHVITRKRLLAGLGVAGVRQMEFVIAEEGITAAAYVVISVMGGTWTIEECGDRDASGARVGALLQALIAREPTGVRPVIRGWLPPGFVPPQVRVTPLSTPPRLLWVRSLLARVEPLRLTSSDVGFWRSDVF